MSIVLTASPAAAHDQLVESTPADAAVVETVPVEVTLRFTEEVMNISSQVIVRGPTGEVVADTEAVVSGALVSAPLPAGLANGAYTVAWRVVSGDGHPIEGSFGFTIAAPVDPAALVATPTPSATETPAATPSATASPAPTSAAGTSSGAASDSATDPSTIGIVLGILAVLVAATAAAVLVRRRRRTP